MVFSTLYEVVVDFTRDYDSIRVALNKIEHYDKTCLENMLQAVNNILLTNWGSQNYCQVLVFTDAGIGFGSTSLQNTISNIKLTKSTLQSTSTSNNELPAQWIPFSYPSKLSFICFGHQNDTCFQYALKLYQEFLDVSGQKGFVFYPMTKDDTITKDNIKIEQITDMITKMCQTNYKQFEAVLKCGGYFKLESPIFIWPPPLPYVNKETEMTKLISRQLEICGYLALSDIGSPMSVSRHLILPKVDAVIPAEKFALKIKSEPANDYEKLEADIKTFYSKNETTTDEESASLSVSVAESTKESVCVLLHGALKVENMAALVLLNDDWYGFIYSYADSKRKSNLMLTVLPPGHDGIPWLGDLRYVGTIDDLLPGENAAFPVKPEKRSYSQNCVVWIKHAGLQSDIQKVLRHAKKLPEKTQNFYKELNRIRRAALSLGFVELLEGLACLFEREISLLPQNASADCAMQLKHSAIELRKLNNRDLKTIITALPTRYNQL